MLIETLEDRRLMSVSVSVATASVTPPTGSQGNGGEHSNNASFISGIAKAGNVSDIAREFPGAAALFAHGTPPI